MRLFTLALLHNTRHVFPRVAFLDCLSLVVLLLSTRECELQFQEAALIVQRKRNERQAGLVLLAEDGLDLFSLHEKLSFPIRIMRPSSVLDLVGGNVRLYQKEFIVFDNDERLADGRMAESKRFYFMAEELQTALERLESFVVETRFGVRDIRFHAELFRCHVG